MAVPQSMSVEMTGRYHARRATLLAPRCSAHSAAYEIASAASSVGCESCGASKGRSTGSPLGFGKVLSARTNTKRVTHESMGSRQDCAGIGRLPCARIARRASCLLACFLVSSWGYFTFLQMKGIPRKGPDLVFPEKWRRGGLLFDLFSSFHEFATVDGGAWGFKSRRERND